ncbi:division/cell wall cluster transcriptional repressor MraZ [Erythrobacter sp. W53]|uniref:division/cell wall cluster transcriptional repressor MraZ n=1 Tax=Erythrobacter sp. W53 TaxID=3425947 RepID=UPI003D76A290
MDFGGFSGQALSLASDKGRYVLPPAFRKALKESSGGRIVCLDSHPTMTCLLGFGLSRKADLMARLDREEELAFGAGREFDRDTRAAQLFGFAERPFDDSGRFVMPDHLRNLAELDEHLYFQGGGASFTIWNPRELMKMGRDWATAKAACDAFMAELEGKKK